MQRVRFSPSPTGSLQVANVLGADARRALGDRIPRRGGDKDPAGDLPGAARAAVDDPRRLGVGWDEAIARLDDRKLAERLDVPARIVPALRGARTLAEACELSASILRVPARRLPDERPTLARFAELRAASPDLLDASGARTILRELKAVGGHLRAVRIALTGQESGPELWAVLVALSRADTLARVDAAL